MPLILSTLFFGCEENACNDEGLTIAVDKTAINEEQMKNVLNGISLLGKILTAGLSSIGNGMSGSTMSSINSGANITGGVFDKLARGN